MSTSLLPGTIAVIPIIWGALAEGLGCCSVSVDAFGAHVVLPITL